MYLPDQSVTYLKITALYVVNDVSQITGIPVPISGQWSEPYQHLGVPNANYVACDACYHRKKCCHPRYVIPKCIAQAFEKLKQTTAYREIIRQIIHQQFLLSSFGRRFQDLASINENVANSDNYSRYYHLKKQLFWRMVWYIMHIMSREILSCLFRKYRSQWCTKKD